MSIRIGAVLGGIVALSVTARSDACSCAPPIAWVTPGPLDAAPVNTHVLVTFDEHAQWCIMFPTCVATQSSVALRVAAHDKVAASIVPTHVVRKTSMGNFVHEDLAPDGTLAPKTRYEVVLVDALGKAPVRVIGTFVTTAAADAGKPEWAATIEQAELAHPSSFMDCGEGDSMTLRVPSVKDESAVLWEIFVAPGDVAIDWSKPPSAVLFPSERYPNGKSLLVVGHDPCAPSVPLPKANSVRIGVRPIDVAGHVGREAEVVRAWPAKKP
jgi:hypothetical protein